ncbi:sigma 54-interacting transcriptional regulator [Bacillus sp. FJAT-47783]|uniref:sigma-54 interaction domain-containing protein n=1 Tax=Bacillus sp. FJAT-47783 TaxID=2922712 RepID=UPI001FAD4D48|nr:sigma 54-interacting transcriptional regulator [Bacillus sp. FJAT-47783]
MLMEKQLPFAKEIVETVLENAFAWLVIVDKDGKIIYMNDEYCTFIGLDRVECLGRHVTEVIENTRMHIVLNTGIEEIAELHYIKGNYMIANRIPIFVEGKVVGAFGTVMFRDTREWNEMNSHVKQHLAALKSIFDKQHRTGTRYSLHDIVSVSEKIEELKERVKSIAASDSSVLICGESGTGKELFAHSIHQLSERSENPFVKVNCGAIPEHLLESELFGYEEGAFTGARKGGKKGKFLIANGGSIFLDEIGDMPHHMQVKLLRVLQEREVEPIGSTKAIPIDVRIITATNKPLEKMMKENRFRKDLFYRLSVIPLYIPPLRERMEDLDVLVYHFMKKLSFRTGKRVTRLQDEVMRAFRQYEWYGNIRELENVIESAINLTKTDEITMADIPEYIKHEAVVNEEEKSLKEMMEELEKRILVRALRKHNGDKKKAAKSLKISKSSIYEKVQKYRIEI